MPEKKTIDEARKAKRQGKSPSTQAGAFVHEEIEHIREGKHGARSAKQAIAIGLSKARRAGVALPRICLCGWPAQAQAAPPAPRLAGGRGHRPRGRGRKAGAGRRATGGGVDGALSRHARAAAKRRPAKARKAAAKKAARTRAPREQS
jgi:hypothetical protein